MSLELHGVPSATTTEAVGFDVHGLVRVALVDANARDTAIVARQLGMPHRPLAGPPTITIRFVDEIMVDRILYKEQKRSEWYRKTMTILWLVVSILVIMCAMRLTK